MRYEDENLPTPSAERVVEHQGEVFKHRDNVNKCLNIVVEALVTRGQEHDISKFSKIENAYYAEYTPNLKGLTYGSDEYKENLIKMKPAIQHHYENNRHHPEHFENGIKDMTLVDLMEMLADWRAATMRHDNGDIIKSMEINKKRFNIDDQLYSILMKTVHTYF